ncbi:flagellar biosynthesis protein FlhF [Immundisolibacter sp.]|uniref:flagellar biosynthesis protein FlhF n=1 Tax=Immundisolibacter sp. TaxID=1934948 RepID=UPI000EEF86A0|nr:flagellar biosynthesis protein FlhF [Gammaproteobacteria bacterium]
MQIKCYSAPDMRRALHQVRSVHGPQAIILSSRRVADGVEVIAADEYDAALLDRLAAAEGGDVSPLTAGKISPAVAGSMEPSGWNADPAIAQLRQELTTLRGLLEAELRHSAQARRSPLQARLAQYLEQLGLDGGLITDLIGAVREQQDLGVAWREALGTHLAARIPIADTDMLADGGVVALIGPTGVGKTTTIAKLAARFVREHGARHLGLLTTDNYRIGAHEQLQNYGRMLGVPVQMVESADDLRMALAALSHKRLVLVDTAGMSQRDLLLGEALGSLQGVALRSYLTLASNAHPFMLDETIATFGALPLAGCVLTKLDECPALGAALSSVIRHRLPVACITDGQRVPEDLRVARARDLVSRAAQQVCARAPHGAARVATAPLATADTVAAHA